MYIATKYFETKFKKVFKQGDIVPNEVAKLYPRVVEKKGDEELLLEDPSVVETYISDDNIEESIKKIEDEILKDEEELKEDEEELKEDEEELKKDKKELKKLKNKK